MVSLYEYFIDTRRELAIYILEYFPGETLLEILRRSSETFDMSTKRNIMLQIFKAISYLHSQNIIHRDLTLTNVLYSTKTGQLKITDFGLAKNFSGMQQTFFSPVGKFNFNDPPEFKKKGTYNEKYDIWCSGLILMQLEMGSWCSGKKIKDKFEFVCRKMNEEMKDFIKNILEEDEEKRIGAREAVEHKWLV